MVAILALGLEESEGLCRDFVEFEGSGDGFEGNGDGKYCSSETGGFLPDQNADQLQYREGQYITHHRPLAVSAIQLIDSVPIVCSDEGTIKATVRNLALNGDEKHFGYVLAFRAVKGRYCGRCATTSGDICDFDNGILPLTSNLTNQCTSELGGRQSQPSCYYKDHTDSQQFGVCNMTNPDCALECVVLETGDSCLFPFTLQGHTFKGCIEGKVINAVGFAEGTYVCPLQYNSSSNEYFDYKVCEDIGGSCTTAKIPACYYDPCHNGAACQNTNESPFGYTCDCDSAIGFIGPNCTSIDPCEPNPCLNGGTCSVETNQDGALQFFCNCPVGTFSPLCDADPCFPNPCGDGICSSSLLKGVYQVDCQCPYSGTVGRFCQRDPCLINPCNSGTCTAIPTVDGIWNSSCSCPDNSTGNFCEVELCNSTFCNEGSRGTALQTKFEFITSSVCNISWTAAEDFIGVSAEDHYLVQLNGSIIDQLPADKPDLFVLITSMDLCLPYLFTIQPMRGTLAGTATDFFIQNWQESKTIYNSFDKFPDASAACGYCPNANLTQLCTFPFSVDGTTHNTCVSKNGPEKNGTLWCVNNQGVEMECTTTLEHCLPPMAHVQNLKVERTLVNGEYEISWTINSTMFSYFNLFLNQEFITSTLSMSYKLVDLKGGSFYNFEVELHSYGRKSHSAVSFPAIISIATVNNDHVLSNVEIEELAEDDDDDDDDPADSLTNDAIAANFSTRGSLRPNSHPLRPDFNIDFIAKVAYSGLQIEIDIIENELIRALFTEEELLSMRQVKRVDLDWTTDSMDNLLPGVTYEITITPVNLFGLLDNSSTITTYTSNNPNQFQKDQNNLTLRVQDNQTITLVGFLNQETVADVIVAIAYEILPLPVLIEVGSLQILADVSFQSNSTLVSCLTNSSCVNETSLQFQTKALHVNLKPGVTYIIEIAGQTGSSTGHKTTVAKYIEPNPINNLALYHRDEKSLRVSWQAPEHSYFRGFIVEYTDHNNQSRSIKINGYLRYIAYNLMPGYEYSISVFTFSDLDGNTKSQPRIVTTSTAPLPPKSISIENLESSEYNARIWIIPPDGLWNHIVVIYSLHKTMPSGFDHQMHSVHLTRANFNATDISLHIYGAIYDITARTISHYGIASSKFAKKTFIKDLPEIFSRRPSPIIINNTFCVIWEIAMNKSQIFLNSVSIRVSQSNMAAMTSQKVADEQTVGLQCFELPWLNISVNAQLHIWAESHHPRLRLSSTSPINYFTYSFNAGSLFDLSASKDCYNEVTGQCLVTIFLSPVPDNLNSLQITLTKIWHHNESVTGQSENQTQRITEITVSGSSCEAISNSSAKCLVTLPSSEEDDDISVLLKICLNNSCLPEISLRLIEVTKEDPADDPKPDEVSGFDLVIVLVSSVLLILVILALVTLTVFCKHCRKANVEKQEKEETIENVYETTATMRYVDTTAFSDSNMETCEKETETTPLDFCKSETENDSCDPSANKNDNEQINIDDKDDANFWSPSDMEKVDTEDDHTNTIDEN